MWFDKQCYWIKSVIEWRCWRSNRWKKKEMNNLFIFSIRNYFLSCPLCDSLVTCHNRIPSLTPFEFFSIPIARPSPKICWKPAISQQCPSQTCHLKWRILTDLVTNLRKIWGKIPMSFVTNLSRRIPGSCWGVYLYRTDRSWVKRLVQMLHQWHLNLNPTGRQVLQVLTTRVFWGSFSIFFKYTHNWVGDWLDFYLEDSFRHWPW